jgi:phage repressor protein C with HTH and peptisase S24 domain
MGDAWPMRESQQILDELGRRGISRAAVARVLGVSQPNATRLWQPDARTGKTRTLGFDEGQKLVTAFKLFEGESDERAAVIAPAAADDEDDIAMVDIQHIDMAYGLGTTFAVDYPDIEVMKFPKVWIESITHSPPATLTWTRGKGDSMEPTIRDGDLVLLDRSQRVLTERDAMWAFTIGEEAAIKRLRKQGEICEIFSDNPNVPPDKQSLRDMNIVGRVVFVGSRK